MEKLARALFAIKKDLSSDSQLSQALPPVLPSFTKPPMATNHMDEMKAKYERAYNPWTADEEEMLKKVIAQTGYDLNGIRSEQVPEKSGLFGLFRKK